MNLKIAICDDNEADRIKLQNILSNYYISSNIEISVDLFSSGKALFQQYKKRQDYHVILLDIEMPEMNGIQIAHIIRTKIDKHVNFQTYNTSKKEKYEHGYGLSNINKIIENKHGIMQYKPLDDYFEITLIIPIIDLSKRIRQPAITPNI